MTTILQEALLADLIVALVLVVVYKIRNRC